MEQDRQGVELAMLRRHVDFEGKSVLEVGCGDGRVSAMLAPLAGSLVAIDPDEARLEKARMRLPGVDFRNGSGEALGFPDCSFDIVAFTFSLHHQNSSQALAEAGRVLKPSGRAIIIEPSVEGDMHPLFRIFRDEDGNLAAALAAIETCELIRESAETFDIEYVFEDAGELHGYFFTHSGMASNPEYIGRINDVLGARSVDRPLRLVETVNIFTLMKI